VNRRKTMQNSGQEGEFCGSGTFVRTRDLYGGPTKSEEVTQPKTLGNTTQPLPTNDMAHYIEHQFDGGASNP
jgi:hypothetical protein